MAQKRIVTARQRIPLVGRHSGHAGSYAGNDGVGFGHRVDMGVADRGGKGVLVPDRNHRVDLDRRTPRQGGHAHRTARMPASIAKGEQHQL